MIKNPLVIVYENCECITVQPEAVYLINLTVDHGEIDYCPDTGIPEPEAKTYVSKLVMQIDLTNPSLLKDSLETEDAVQVVTKRRDITCIEMDGVSYHVNWFPAEHGYSPLQYTNAYQDPAVVHASLGNRNVAHITIDATRPDPEYKKGLVSGSYLYIAEYEGSNTYTRRYRLKFPIRGFTEVAVKSVYESTIENQSKVYCRNIVNDRIENIDVMYRKDITWLDDGIIAYGVEDCSCETGYWKGRTMSLTQVDNIEFDARFPVFKSGVFIKSHATSAIDGLTKEIQDQIDKETLEHILHSSWSGLSTNMEG